MVKLKNHLLGQNYIVLRIANSMANSKFHLAFYNLFASHKKDVNLY